MSNATRFRAPLYIKPTLRRAVRRRWHHDATGEFLYALRCYPAACVRTTRDPRAISSFCKYIQRTLSRRSESHSAVCRLNNGRSYTDDGCLMICKRPTSRITLCSRFFLSFAVISHIRVSYSVFAIAAFRTSFDRYVTRSWFKTN